MANYFFPPLTLLVHLYKLVSNPCVMSIVVVLLLMRPERQTTTLWKQQWQFAFFHSKMMSHCWWKFQWNFPHFYPITCKIYSQTCSWTILVTINVYYWGETELIQEKSGNNVHFCLVVVASPVKFALRHVVKVNDSRLANYRRKLWMIKFTICCNVTK